jgi:hypothetical protein
MTPLDNPLPGMQVNYTLLREEPLLDKAPQVTGLNND